MSSQSPAGRLLALFKELRDQKNDLNTIGTFSRLAAGDATNFREGYRLLATVFELIEESRQQVSCHPELRQELFHGALTNIEQLFKSTLPNAPWSAISDPLGQQMVGLEFCAERLDGLTQEQVVDNEELAALRDLAEQLVGALLECELEAELKEQLVRRAEDIRRALVEYRMHGAKGLEVAVAAAVGTLAMNHASVRRASKSAAVTKFLDLVLKLDSVVRISQRWKELAGPAIKGLLSAAAGGDLPPAAS